MNAFHAPGVRNVWIAMICSVAAGVSLTAPGWAVECDPLLTDRLAEMDQVLPLNGGQRIRQSVQLPAQTPVLVIAVKQGVDATLEVHGPDGRLLGSADNPVHRTGLQRNFFSTGAAGEYSIELAGKEGPQVSGSVRLRLVVPGSGGADDTCVRVQRQLGTADGDYAAAMAILQPSYAGSTAAAPQRLRAAADEYIGAAKMLANTGESVALEAEAQHAASAVLYQELSQWSESEGWAEQSMVSYESAGDAYGRARAQAMAAAALMEMASSMPAPAEVPAAQRPSALALGKARGWLRELEEFHRRRGEIYDEALVTNNLGLAYYYEDKNEEAIRNYERVLPLYEQLNDRSRQAQVLNNIALAEYELGRSAEASNRYAESLGLVDATAFPELHATTLANRALAQIELGQYDEALAEYNDALQVWQRRRVAYGQGLVLKGIGNLYYSLGDHEQALEYYQQALQVLAPGIWGRGRARTLSSVANILHEQGDAAGALLLHREALSVEPSESRRTIISMQIAADLDALGRSGEATTVIGDATSKTTLDHWSRNEVRMETARHHVVAGELSTAALEFAKAAREYQRQELANEQFDAMLELARTKLLAGLESQARQTLVQAMSLAEQIRLQSANPELRASLQQPLRPAFDLEISLLAKQYRLAGPGQRTAVAMMALRTAERARSRAMMDYRALDASSPAVPVQLLQRRQVLLQEIATRRGQLESRLAGGGAGSSLAVELQSEIGTRRRQLQQMDSEIAIRSGTGHSGSEHIGAGQTIRLEQVPADAAVVEYWVGSQDTYVWVLTHEGLTMANLGASSVISGSARAFHAALSGSGSQAAQEGETQGERLWLLVVAPMDRQLSGKRRLIVAADEALHYIPFAALRERHDGRSQYLVERFDISSTPSVGMLLAGAASGNAKSGNDGRILLVSDPVYQSDDTRLATSSRQSPVRIALKRGVANPMNLQRLPGTEVEARSIAALFPESRVDQLAGLNASREKVLATDLLHYQFIHFASHGFVDAVIPQLSSLVLSTRDGRGNVIDGSVRAADLMTKRLSAYVVVLSACETALGKSIGGEGLMGLRYVVLARGARNVVASLWEAPDQITSTLMTKFYSGVIQGGQSAAASMSEAMREMLKSGVSDPSLWAAFGVTET